MHKSILGTCLQSVSTLKNGRTAHRAIVEEKPFWHKPIRRRGEEQQGCQGNRGLAYTPPPQCPSIGPVPLCVSGVLNFTDPPGLGRPASIDQDKRKGDEPGKPAHHRGQRCSLGQQETNQRMTKSGIACFNLIWLIS